MTVHPYCLHDEGEPCDCVATLQAATLRPAAPTNRPKTAGPRAAAVRQLTAEGLETHDIAARLGMTCRSVQRHRRRTP